MVSHTEVHQLCATGRSKKFGAENYEGIFFGFWEELNNLYRDDSTGFAVYLKGMVEEAKQLLTMDPDYLALQFYI
jgi:hypothetical protein